MGQLEQTETEADREFNASEHAPAFAYAKRLTFSADEPLKRVITEVGSPVSYKVSTKLTIPLIGSDVTTITCTGHGVERTVAVIHWNDYEDDRSELEWYNGEKIKLWEYLKAPGAIQYGAKVSRTFQLVDEHETKLARDIRNNVGFFMQHTVSGGLLVNSEGLDMLDEIIVTHTALAQLERMEYFVRRDVQAVHINHTLKA
ncbi:hypothetical protein CALCODRAFT_484540 [Calocera cornea HHB12733]|uniref:DUF6593 domain-containing protein n=1 Tax=Calocera cornea HHB12733 TaxID=1353952 RepID=A0A165EYD9_9BASI|nr:hypothetical protein CALCODRAFT_484540 [Calocera cornea HHB12733]